MTQIEKLKAALHKEKQLTLLMNSMLTDYRQQLERCMTLLEECRKAGKEKKIYPENKSL